MPNRSLFLITPDKVAAGVDVAIDKGATASVNLATVTFLPFNIGGSLNVTVVVAGGDLAVGHRATDGNAPVTRGDGRVAGLAKQGQQVGGGG